ncbi:hypothetical protein CASFOL_003637 [Castilleja foliolosa]|uniref:Uncharacterized protein n=1 Tax=Castilleja foliolosa TaxID=1961234 RepID=A0ABD3EID1_9LAMI
MASFKSFFVIILVLAFVDCLVAQKFCTTSVNQPCAAVKTGSICDGVCKDSHLFPVNEFSSSACIPGLPDPKRNRCYCVYRC